MSEVKNRPQRKPCIMCNQEKPDNVFYWYPYATQQGKASVRRESRCKECAQQRRRDRYAENTTKENAWSAKWKSLNKERLYTYTLEYRNTTHGRANVRAAIAKRQAAQLQRIPPWADLDAIKAIYVKAKEQGLTVDHVIPLQGERVSGLHVASNLQLLSKAENSRKKNHFAVA